MKGKFIKVCRCPHCRGEAVIFQADLARPVYSMYCFGCDSRNVGVDPLLYPDIFKAALISIVERLRYKKEEIPSTASWKDVQVALLGMIDVRNLELFNLRKFFEGKAKAEHEQLNFYHLLKRKSDKEARLR